MTDLLDLTAAQGAAPAAGPSPGVLALRHAHELHPEAKLMHLTDARHGAACVLAIGPDSPWHELLPAWQYAKIISTVEAA